MQLLFVTIVVLFASLHGGAALASAADARSRARTAAQLATPAAGFRQLPDGTQLWRFHLVPPRGAVDVPSGSATVLASVFGVPFARLRASLPDELVSSDLGAVFGRQHALSKRAMEIAFHAQSSSKAGGAWSPPPPPPPGRSSVVLGNAMDEMEGAGTTAGPQPPTPAQALEDLVGTSMVLAFLQVAQLCPVMLLARRRADAARHFGALTTPSGLDFHRLFSTMLCFHMSLKPRRWFERARVWRLILSQSRDGSWPASNTVAFALRARPAAEVAASPPLTRFARALLILQDGDAANCHERHASRGAAAASALPPPRASSAPLPIADTHLDDGFAGDDCTLAGCTRAALLAPMPRPLAALVDSPGADPTTLWATLCAVTFLRRVNVSWLACSESSPVQHTIVDAADRWVARHAAAHPPVAAALADGSVADAAMDAAAGWAVGWEVRVGALRRAEPVIAQRARSHFERTATAALCAFRQRHELAATFLCEPLDGLQRWQRWACVVTMVVVALMVNVWCASARVGTRVGTRVSTRVGCAPLRCASFLPFCDLSDI